MCKSYFLEKRWGLLDIGIWIVGDNFYLLTYLSSSDPSGLLRPAKSAADATAAPHECNPSWFFFFLHCSSPRFSRPASPPLNFRCPRQMLPGLVPNTCPFHFYLLTLMKTDTGVLPVASYSSSLLRWLGQNLLSTLLRHVR